MIALGDNKQKMQYFICDPSIKTKYNLTKRKKNRQDFKKSTPWNNEAKS